MAAQWALIEPPLRAAKNTWAKEEGRSGSSTNAILYVLKGDIPSLDRTGQRFRYLALTPQKTRELNEKYQQEVTRISPKAETAKVNPSLAQHFRHIAHSGYIRLFILQKTTVCCLLLIIGIGTNFIRPISFSFLHPSS